MLVKSKSEFRAAIYLAASLLTREHDRLSLRLDEAVEAARTNGGKILRARQQIGQHGFRAVIIDSEGNRIALHTSAA